MSLPNYAPNYTAVPAGAADVAVKTAPGALFKVIVRVAGTAPTVIQDAATGHAGTVLLNIPTATVAGTIFTLDCPVLAGITVVGAATNADVIITFC